MKYAAFAKYFAAARPPAVSAAPLPRPRTIESLPLFHSQTFVRSGSTAAQASFDPYRTRSRTQRASAGGTRSTTLPSSKTSRARAPCAHSPRLPKRTTLSNIFFSSDRSFFSLTSFGRTGRPFSYVTRPLVRSKTPGFLRRLVCLRGDHAPVEARRAFDEVPAVYREVAPGDSLEDVEEVRRGRMAARAPLAVGSPAGSEGL